MDGLGLIILGLIVFMTVASCIAAIIFKYRTYKIQSEKLSVSHTRKQIRAEQASKEMRELIRAELASEEMRAIIREEIRTELTKEQIRAELRAELEAELAELAKAQAVGTKNHTTVF